MKFLKISGLILFCLALVFFTIALNLSQHRLTEDTLAEEVPKTHHQRAFLHQAETAGLLGQRYTSHWKFIGELRKVMHAAQKQQDEAAGIVNWQATKLPDGVAEWDFRLGKGDVKSYLFQLTKASTRGAVDTQAGLLFWLTFGLGILGALLYFLPDLGLIPGIKNNHIYQQSATRGVNHPIRLALLGAGILTALATGILTNPLMGILTLIATALIFWLVASGFKKSEIPEGQWRKVTSEKGMGWLALATGIYLTGFYVLLYFYPEYLTGWVLLVDPISRALSGNPASQWFLYGFLYTIAVLVMGIRMLIKYRHNRYQLIRTGSVMFFQTAFAFIIPEILVRLNQPYFDFKNIWPLNYSFFFDYNLNSLIQGGNLGMFMLVWGIVLALVGVPLLTYFFGKRWYCSWVCGCGGLAETLGDPYRQLSDKSLKAWKYERYIIHGVLVFAVVMTLMVLYLYFTGSSRIFFVDAYSVRGWYGFLIGSMFAGVVGTGFYPLMGNRVWCRFGCPLAAYLGLVQRFKSRFRITTNGGQCISCGNCSTYCEMGIDVRWYAQRGQDIVRSSCVGCGICSAVCPRGVLRLENSSLDVNTRGEELRALHISKDGNVNVLM